jgi:hypothetical protein
MRLPGFLIPPAWAGGRHPAPTLPAAGVPFIKGTNRW